MRIAKKLLKGTLIVLGVAVTVIVVLCLIPIKPTIALLKARADTQYWVMSKGHRIAYTRAAAQSQVGKSPIIFLHGGPGGYVHSSVIKLLSDLTDLGGDVYFYDQAGSGLSSRLPKPKDYSFLGHVADLEEIVTQQIHASRVILIGHSYGGQLAAQFTAMHPELVERLVLSSPGTIQPSIWENGKWVNETKYPRPDSLKFVSVDRQAMDGLRIWTMRGMASLAVATVFNRKFMPDAEADGLMNTLAARFTTNMVCDSAHVLPEEGGAGFYVHGWSNYYGDLADPRPMMRQCPTPVLIMQGTCDYIPYASTYEYVDLFPNSRYVCIEGAGHIIWWDKPGDYFCHIVDFITAAVPSR